MSTIPSLKTLCAAATPGPYFVDHHKGTMEDFLAHAHSGLATVDTGREGDWPVAYFCEWPQAQLIARLSPEVVLAIAAFIQSTPRAHVLNPNDEGRECRCGQCERWYESRRLQRVLDGQPEAT